jgi:hypothetical protein
VLAGPAAYSVTTVSRAHTGSIVTAGPASAGGPGGGFPGGGFPGGPPTGRAQTGQVPMGQMSAGPASAGGQMPAGGGTAGMGGLLDASTPSDEVVAMLTEDAGDYTWAAATVGSQNAAGLQLGSEEPVMAIGGFNGSDPSPPLAEFQRLVADGEIHWFVSSGDGGAMPGGPGTGTGGSGTGSAITSWVEENVTATTVDGKTFYDLSQGATS